MSSIGKKKKKKKKKKTAFSCFTKPTKKGACSRNQNWKYNYKV
ncbi:hypothetical protein HanLR1_Chr00c0911g0781401 [Helianthus annuus]|nr:hypothetical protein HanLR1_Chr00c0911g0781401 [Helianthus annuus]